MSKNTDSRTSISSLSLRQRLFLFMLAVSMVPVGGITIFAALNTYRKLYSDTIKVNSEGMNWTHTQLGDLSGKVKDLFYSMEFDQNYKEAVIRLNTGYRGYDALSDVRTIMLERLNLAGFAEAFILGCDDSPVTVYADRAEVSIKNEHHGMIQRPTSLQNNLFFKKTEAGITAVHNMYTFEDRNLIAQQQIILKDRILPGIISTLQLYDNERIYILNDEGELLHASPGEDEADLSALPAGPLEQYPGTRFNGNIMFAETGGMIVFASYDPRSTLRIVKAVPRSEIIQSVLPTVYSGIVMGILSLFLAVGASAIFSTIFSRPIVRLAGRVQSIKLEHLVLEEDEHTSDEIRILEDHISLFVERIRELIRNEYDITLQSRVAQIKALQAQINPHFLHNTLQLIGSISLANDVPEVYRISSDLSNLMRYSMDFSSTMVTLNEELEHLRRYLHIQEQRFGERIRTDYHIDAEAGDCVIPKLLLQPLVENAFDHGFDAQSGKWVLSITAFVDEAGKMHIIVRDNGAGIQKEQVDLINEELNKNRPGALIASAFRTGHIGLVNVNDRIRLSFSDRDGVRLSSHPGRGTTVELVFDGRKS